MICPYCHASIDETEDYCPNCGNLLPLPYCVNCGMPLKRGDAYCSRCGAAQNAEPGRQQSGQAAQQQYRKYSDNSDENIEEEDFDDWDDDDTLGKKWIPLVVVVVIAAVVVVVFAAWNFGILGNLSFGRQDAVETAEVEEEEVPHQLSFVTQTLEFDEPNLTSRIYFDTDIEDQSEIAWTSSDPSVARVDGNGYVTSVDSGRAVVTAQWGDLSASCSIACDYTSTVQDTAEGDEDLQGDEEEADAGDVVAAADGDYLCSFSSERLITADDISAISAAGYETLPAGKSLPQMIINEIYAKHGFKFQTAEIQRYFEQKDWYNDLGSYSEDSGVVMGRMNDIEKQNIEFLNNNY